jgi:hypothetical protein
LHLVAIDSEEGFAWLQNQQTGPAEGRVGGCEEAKEEEGEEEGKSHHPGKPPGLPVTLEA